MTTSRNIQRSITGLRHSAKRLLTHSSSFTSNDSSGKPFGSRTGLDRDFARVAHDLDAISRHSH